LKEAREGIGCASWKATGQRVHTRKAWVGKVSLYDP
jgi:hypothetical protein